MNKKLWGNFRRHVPRMTVPEEKVELNKARRVYNKEHMGEVYVSFEHDWQSKEDGRELHSWINLDEDEWATFVSILWQIDQLMPTYQRFTCVVCCDDQTTKEMWGGKLKRTLLDDNTLSEAIDANAVDREGQDGPIVCEYCGEGMVSFQCHCHKFDCRKCSEENFCKGCGENIYKEL